MSVTINVDMDAIESLIDGLAVRVESAVRPAAQAAAQVLYDEVKRNVAGLGRLTGNLDRAIYQAYSRDGSVDGERAVYHVSWNASKAPHGHLVEYGYLQRHHVAIGRDGKWFTDVTRPLPAPRHVGAHPFVRPAMSKFSQAMEAAKAALVRHINEDAQ